MRTAEQALAENNFDGTRLLGLARSCANAACRRLPYAPPGLADELASFLTEQALVATLNYDAARSGEDYTYASYAYDVMALRVADFFRRKSEGFGDRRHGNHDRIVLVADPLESNGGLWDGGYDEVDERLSAHRLVD